MYSVRELEGAVYYPACGFDFRPLFSLASDLFIYVDWRDVRWSASPEQYVRTVLHPGCCARQTQLSPKQNARDKDAEDLFRPCTPQEFKERIRQQVEKGVKDFGFMGDLDRGLKELNRELAPDHLEYKRDRHVPFGSVGAIGLDSIKKNLPGLALTAAERRDYRAARVVQRPWAREITLSRGTGRRKHEMRLLYITGEGIATYCKLYASRRIAPRVLFTTGTGMGPKFADLEDPTGIMARVLRVCQKRPLLWSTEM